MKTKLLLLAAATALLAGCTDDLERRSSYTPEGGLQASIPSYPFDGGTRVSISDDLQTFTWSNGDQIGLYYQDGSINAHAGFTILQGGGTLGTFTNNAFSLQPSSTYYGFYPFDENATVNEAPVDFTGQVQTMNGSAAHLGARNYMYAVVNTNEKGYAQIQFQNVASVMAIRLPAPATDTYSKLVIHPNGTDFYSKGIANMTDGLIQPTESTNIMTLSFGSEGITVNEGDLISLYMFVAPVDMSNSNLTFTLYSAEPGAPPYESITTKGKTMLPGKAYLYDLTNREVPYVTFTASAEQTMHLSQEVPSLEYSVNEGTWTTLGTNTVTFGDTKGTLRLRGKSLKGTQGATVVFGNETKVACSGDICTLVDYENYETVNTSEAVFIQLFQECTQLTSAPRLPSLQLAPQCYLRMFIGCTSLTQAPDLPATTLTPLCYYSMFQQCTSLTTLPELPAMVMADRCYNFMFAGCKFNTAPELPATVLANGCYNGMFYGCTSLFTAPELPATVMADGCYQQMFAGCENLFNAPALPATTLAERCYAGMFKGCTNLSIAPELPAIELANGCYANMFDGCTSLRAIKVMAVNWNNPTNWVRNVSSTGNFIMNDKATWYQEGPNGIPTGWTVETTDGTPYVTFKADAPQSLKMSKAVSTLEYSVKGGTWTALGTNEVTFGGSYGDLRLRGKSAVGTDWATISFGLANDTKVACSGDIRTLVDWENYPTADTSGAFFTNLFQRCTQLTSAPDLPSTDLQYMCYQSMFQGCTSLTTAPALPATKLAFMCYKDMFYGCTSLQAAPELPATDLTGKCYQGMFTWCTSLTTAPALPATKLADSCYDYMFQNCESLTQAPVLPATELTSGCYRRMFQGCISLTQAPVLLAQSLVTQCYPEMFKDCTSLNSITMLAAEANAEGCLTGWVDNVATSGTFTKNRLATWSEADVIPARWVVLEEGNTPPYITFKADDVQTYQMSKAVANLEYFDNSTATWTALGTNEVTFGGANGDLHLRGKSAVGTDGAQITFGNDTPVACSGDIRTLVDWENYPTANTSQAVFSRLFMNCTQLTSAPALPITNLANTAYQFMFSGCTSLTRAPALPATTLSSSCYGQMFAGCTSLTAAPALPATTLASACYIGMFTGCTSLEYAPELPATTLTMMCYSSMFAGCSSLSHITMMATDISAMQCLSNWVNNVASSGTFVKNAAATWNVTGVDGIPEGWTVQTASE